MAAQRFFEIGSMEFVIDFRLKVTRGGGVFQATCPEVPHKATGATIDQAEAVFYETLPAAWIDGIIDSLPVEEQREVRMWLQDEPAVQAA